MSEVVTRFAPSPTGLLHLGNVRTALLNWLYARKHGGRFLLRFEDTDRERSEKEFIEAIQHDLNWLGLAWDGEVLFQSSHHDRHLEALSALCEKDLAYRCFCSESQLAIDRKLAASRGLPPRYAGRCRKLGKDESELLAESQPFVWRLAVHDASGEVVVRDQLRNDVTFARADLDDPVVVRSDGTFTFLLPNAIDDALDGITHTLRGDDHLTNSAYQVWLLGALGYTPPVYLHHGLLLSESGSKLSKRTGSHNIAELRDDGLFPEALLQAMARLGHPNMPDEVLEPEQLAEHFEAQHVSTSSVRWSDEPMWRWHTRILHALPPEKLAPLLAQFFPGVDEARLRAFSTLIEGNLSRIEEVEAYRRLFDVASQPDGDVLEVARQAGAEFYAQAIQAWSGASDWRSWTGEVGRLTGQKGKSLFMPLRVALTGLMHGPEMSHVVEFLGKDGVRERLEDVMGRMAS